MWKLVAALMLALGLASLSAHEVIVEQLVEMTLEPQRDRLVVRLHVPAAVSGDPGLPALLRQADSRAIDQQLRIVAADVARNLDLQQGEVPLAEPAMAARAGADAASLDVELTYDIRADGDPVSARLNAFGSTIGPVRTTARYRRPPSPEQTVSVTGPASRVVFDPPAATVVPQFAARALRAILEDGDLVLFAACVLLTVRRGRSAATLFAAGALGQTAAMALSMARGPIGAEWIAGAGMIAASAIAVAALQVVVGARTKWVMPLAAAFGVLNGWLLGQTAGTSAQFAGAHAIAALIVFCGVILLGEFWLGALAWAFRIWLDERGVPERFVSLAAAAIIAHRAMHGVVDRGQVLAQGGSFAGERAVVWLTLGWAGVLLIAAVSNAMSNRAGTQPS